MDDDCTVDAQFAGLRYFALDGTDHLSHEVQRSMIRRYLHWRNRHADRAHLADIVDGPRSPEAD
jgi:hypothetical protein